MIQSERLALFLFLALHLLHPIIKHTTHSKSQILNARLDFTWNIHVLGLDLGQQLVDIFLKTSWILLSDGPVVSFHEIGILRRTLFLFFKPKTDSLLKIIILF